MEQWTCLFFIIIAPNDVLLATMFREHSNISTYKYRKKIASLTLKLEVAPSDVRKGLAKVLKNQRKEELLVGLALV